MGWTLLQRRHPVPCPHRDRRCGACGACASAGASWTRGRGHLAAGVVWVVAMVRVQGLQEDAVSDGARRAAGLVQHGQNAPVGPLHQVHDGGVVEVFHLRQKERWLQPRARPRPAQPRPQAQVRGCAHALPGDALPLVLLLLLLQDELDEQLLQLLVAVVDAELLEAGGKGPSAPTHHPPTITRHPLRRAGFMPCAVRAARQPRPQRLVRGPAPGPQGPHCGVPPATQASPLPQLVYPWLGEVSRALASLGSTRRVTPGRPLGT